MMPPATTEEIQEVLGEVDALAIERVLQTGATADEVAEAVALLDDEARIGERRVPSSAQVAAVRDILEELTASDDEDAYASDGQRVT